MMQIAKDTPEKCLSMVRADTSMERPKDRAEFWNEVVRKHVVQLECKTANPLDLLCKLEGFSCSSGSANLISVGQMSVRRLARSIDSEPSDAVVLNLVLRGKMHVAQLGTEGQLTPGDFSICVADRPYELQIPAGIQIASFRVPVEHIGCNAVVLKRLAARTLSGSNGMVPLVRAYAFALMRQRLTATQMNAKQAMRHLALLLGAAVQEVLQDIPVQQTEHCERFILKIKHYILTNIDSDQLNAASVAAAMHVSTRYLQRLWASEDVSMSDYIAAKRLERVTKSLSDPARAIESLTQIAISHGYVNMSHFSRIFKEKHGVSPSTFRELVSSKGGY